MPELVWMTLQGTIGAVDRGPGVPFLPVNAELSATRNQARQKLGRLNPREFTTLLIDVLSEAKRRQLGGLRVSTKSIASLSNLTFFIIHFTFLFLSECSKRHLFSYLVKLLL